MSGHDRAPDPRPDPLTELARELAASLAPMADDPRSQRSMIVTFARNLRETLARERNQRPGWPDEPRSLRCQRELANAVAHLPNSTAPRALVADLRLFARLTIGECAALLDSPRHLLLQASPWKAVTRTWYKNRCDNFIMSRNLQGEYEYLVVRTIKTVSSTKQIIAYLYLYQSKKVGDIISR